MKYRKKPVVIEAIQWTGYNIKEIMKFLESEFEYEANTSYSTKKFVYDCRLNKLYVVSLEGNMLANVGDYIIKGVNGEYYPCKHDIFKKTYEKVE